MTNQNVSTDMDPRIKGVIMRPRIVILGKQASPTMPIGLNEGIVGRSVCPEFWKSTYGSSLAKASETNSGNCHIVGIDQIMMSPDHRESALVFP